MRTVRVSGGYTDALHADISDRLMGDPAGWTIRAALIGEDADLPPRTDPVWKSASVDPDRPGSVAVYVESTQPPGHYRLWLLVIAGPLAVPVQANDETTGRPLLVHVV